MRQHDREEGMLDEVAQAIAEQILGQFLEWVMHQDERDQVPGALLVRAAEGRQGKRDEHSQAVVRHDAGNMRYP